MPLVDDGQLYAIEPRIDSAILAGQSVDRRDFYASMRRIVRMPVRLHFGRDNLTNDSFRRDYAMRHFLAIERKGELPEQFLTVRNDDRGYVVRFEDMPDDDRFPRSRGGRQHNDSGALGPCAVNFVD